MINLFNPEIRNNIKIFEIADRTVIPQKINRKREKPLFS
jgi:hypothetical protein